MKDLLAKLALVKSEIGTLTKNSENPFFKSKYLDLNDILTHLEPLLTKNNLILLQPVTEKCVSTIIFDLSTDQKITSCIPLPEINDPQKIGSAITYYRRYSLQSLLALQAEDDDANGAVGKTKEPAKAEVKEPIKKRLNDSHEKWNEVCEWLLKQTDRKKAIRSIKSKYEVSDKVEESLIKL